MSTGSTGAIDEYVCTCNAAESSDQLIYSVPDCNTCTTEACTEKMGVKSNMSSCSTAGVSIKFPLLILSLVLLLIIGYYAFWFMIVKRSVNKFESSKSKRGGGGMRAVIIVLFILAALSSFLYPLSGMSILFLLVLGVWLSAGNKTKKPRAR